MFDHIPPLWAPNNSFTIAGGVVSNPEDTDFAFHIHSYDEIYIFSLKAAPHTGLKVLHTKTFSRTILFLLSARNTTV